MGLTGEQALGAARKYVAETMRGAGAIKGDTGKSAYQSALDTGFVGTEAEWIEHLKGKDGKDGEKGDKGDKGEKGDTGENGEKGDTGEPGKDAPLDIMKTRENHIVGSWDSDLGAFALYGKAKQNTTSGKNLCELRTSDVESKGIKITINRDGTFNASGTATENVSISLINNFNEINEKISKGGNFVFSLKNAEYNNNTCNISCAYKVDNQNFYVTPISGYKSVPEGATLGTVGLYVPSGVTVDLKNVGFQLESGTVATEWGNYTGGKPSPNPSYPQEIEVSGESYNLLPYPYKDSGTKTTGGITFVETDGIITANGTATGTNPYFIIKENWICPKGEYIISGCPSGGSASNYYIRVNNSTQGTQVGNEVGNGLKFTTNGTDAYTILVIVSTNAKVENLTFYPMIRKASVKNDRYMPYGKGSVEVKSVGKNLLPYPYLLGTNTNNGITFTDNEDGSITINGTATANAFFNFIHSNSKSNIGLKHGDKIKVTCKNMRASGNGMLMAVILRDANDTNLSLTNVYDGEYTIEVPENYSHFYSYIYVANGTKVENLTIYPMIRYAEITDNTWQPYKETLSTIPTPNGLAGIKVSSGGNYTDQNGQQWICDEVVKYADGSGAYIQRIGKKVFDGVNNVCGFATNVQGKTETVTQMNLGRAEHMADVLFVDTKTVMCDKFVPIAWKNGSDSVAYSCRVADSGIVCCYLKESDGITDVATANAWLQENNVTVYYILKEPITTPLTEEELAEISTFYPITNISNDFDCGMEIEYATTQTGAYVLKALKNNAIDKREREEMKVKLTELENIITELTNKEEELPTE